MLRWVNSTCWASRTFSRQQGERLSAVSGTWISSVENQNSSRAGARGNDHAARAGQGKLRSGNVAGKGQGKGGGKCQGCWFSQSDKSSQLWCAPSLLVFRCSSVCPPPLALASAWLLGEENFLRKETPFSSRKFPQQKKRKSWLVTQTTALLWVWQHVGGSTHGWGQIIRRLF